MGREEEEAFFIDDEEESSQCSSGCQSGWTLYLDHSGSGQQQQCCALPRHPADVRRQMLLQEEYSSDEEDSMVSDASSGPAHYVRDDKEELLQVQGQISKQRRSSFGVDPSGSRSLLPARSHSSGEAKLRKKRRTALQGVDEAAIRCHVDVDDDDDLDDTASSSAVVASDHIVEAMRQQQPSCGFMAEHCSSLDLEWPAGLEL
jgi:hypothetical protein